MAFASSTFQRVLDNEFFTNSLAEDQPQTSTIGTLIANLNFVRNAISSLSTLYLPINNPTFTGLLSGPTATIPSITGNTNFSGTVTASTISSTTFSTTTINGNPSFTGNPTLNINSANYQLSYRVIGEIKMLLASATVPYFLECNGSSYSTTTYATLFNKIGYSYGGSGVSFNVPNFASHYPIGNNGSINGVPTSNYATGNNTVGSSNNGLFTYNYQLTSSNLTALLTEVPQHNHNTTFSQSVPSTITPLGVQEYQYDGGSFTGTDTLSTGTGIATITDPISQGDGINITMPYVAVAFFICYI